MIQEHALRYGFSVALSIWIAGLAASASGQMETVEIAKTQVVASVSGVVRDSTGAPIPGAKVSEVSSDLKMEIQSTTTDKDGKFSLAPKHKQKIHHLVISKRNFNPLLIHVKVSRWTSRLLVLRLHVAS